MNRSLPTLLSLSLCCLGSLPGCGRDPGEPPAILAERVENAELRIAIASLPEGFDVTANQGPTLDLEREKGFPPGRAWIEVGPPVEGGINLLEVIGGQRQAFEALPGGSFNGNGELVLPDGRPGYYSRGRFQDEAGLVEELRIWSVHPLEKDRLLAVYYRYPAGEDSLQRLEDINYLVGELEALPAGGAEAQGAP